ncbi:TolC family protein [Legionella pneumophila]|nr:TolC family protein [Legionella pneumophila]
MYRKRWLILLCALLNNGCLWLGSEYRKPHVNTPQKWPHKYSIQTEKSAYLPDLHWWKQFNSKELNASIQKALQNNHQIHLAMANIESAQGQLQQVQLSWLPNLTGLAGYTQFPVLGNPGLRQLPIQPTSLIFSSNISNKKAHKPCLKPVFTRNILPDWS